ncbi:MAG: hypothetical protein EOP09_12100 [Proteobacteria bacterium]|nr:MAG: hypothetical protein EOP09_12100 [Pseudomonadota bacterium]
MKKKPDLPIDDAEILLSIYSSQGYEETQSKQFALATLTLDVSKKPKSKTDETKSQIKEILKAQARLGKTTTSVKFVEDQLKAVYNIAARPAFLLGKGASGLYLKEVGKTKSDGRIYLIPDLDAFGYWYEDDNAMLPLQYYGKECFDSILAESLKKDPKKKFVIKTNAYFSSNPVKRDIERAEASVSAAKSESATKRQHKRNSPRPSLNMSMTLNKNQWCNGPISAPGDWADPLCSEQSF